MRILIATGIFPPDIGGPATILSALAKSLEDNGLEVKILTYSDEALKKEKNVFRVGRKQNRFFKYLKYFFEMWKLSKWADIVYVTDIYSVGYFAYLIKKFTGKKYIVRFAGDSAWETAVGEGWTNDYIIDFQNKTYNNRIEKMKMKRKKILIWADKIIAVSQFLADVASKIGVEKKKIKMIYNAIDFEINKNDNSVGIRNQFDKDAKIIICIARLVIWKGIDTVVKIMPSLVNKIGNIHFLVLGDGPELENLKKLASEKGVKDRVHFLGRINRDEIINYLKESDLFILNTNYEGLSHVVLEAMAAGVPVITTKVGGNPEIIEDGKDGLLINYNNEEELLNAAIIIFSNSSLRDSLVENAKDKLKKFNWSNTVRETLNLLREVMYEKHPSY
jgi:glycosyltransferase involved in cell wall biosynthesis